MYSLLLVLVMQVASPGAQPPIVDIVVPASAAAGTLRNVEELARPNPRPGFNENSRAGLQAKTLLEFLHSHEPLRSVVDHFNPEARP